MRPRVLHVLLGLPLLVAACGLVSGLDPLHVGEIEGGADSALPDVADGSVVDEGTSDDAALDVGSCESGSCNAPSGFQPVLFASDRNTACAGSTDVLVDPAPAQTSKCTCSCNTTTATAVCLPQPQIVMSTGTLTCSTPANVPVVLNGGCATFNAGSPGYASIGPFPLIDGGCTGKLSATGSVASTNGRVCPVASCAACQPPAGYQLCYLASGAVSCPSGMTAHTIAASATFSCSACSACSATGSCQGTLQTFSSNLCGNLIDTLPVSGTCQQLKGNIIRSFDYLPTADLTGCTAGTSTAGVSLGGQGTVCCP